MSAIVDTEFGRHSYVGDVTEQWATADEVAMYKVVYTDGDVEDLTLAQLQQCIAQYAKSAARHTAPTVEPSPSLLAATRATAAGARRPDHSAADLARAARAERRARRAAAAVHRGEGETEHCVDN